jgi:hypothetical protein
MFILTDDGYEGREKKERGFEWFLKIKLFKNLDTRRIKRNST